MNVALMLGAAGGFVDLDVDDPENNRPTNLKYGTDAENLCDAERNGRRPSRIINNKETELIGAF